MKRFFALLLLLSAMVCANAQVWYYVDSDTDITTGASSRSGNKHHTAVIVKDSNGDLWMYYEVGYDSPSYDTPSAILKMKDAFTISSNFFINAFNNSEYLKGIYSTNYNQRCYTEEKMRGSDLWKFFCFIKLKYVETMQKCYIYEYNHGAKFQIAIGKDFQTIIQNPDTSRPIYFTNYSPEDFISHRSADDLF